ncbi:monovalent cation/H+ antiporter subunit A [Xanthomonas graminis]|jgi:multicomponent K+:H+ antiporter subunit A|uniref:monovalent cation/H+ antiporter subunit A n=1 Tax=Xanthomonas graminis TaxID=3390026 RepID=UPI00029C8DA6|nr:monovalent cation/H+ antiporter subunit A [Xanthomonas translucens]EKU26584.1 monovalent cation:proton antiporter subunit A/B [Xanthomonas translucens pv. graminis ART-Xtg29]OAX63142.1 cation:proton antiporter [Xanthomonas translucens pv. graminis]UKE54667.1 monovalent cation/H+ antiporter subunit A [Xanthomonas translucens pv. graminis]WIH09054.1 monovalent cation/H+ antiporter subunit A [Xanthomonas translucens pv. graminis]WIH12504.1 monovalent cation/H+ antiporter subunit A [Xanthomonas
MIPVLDILLALPFLMAAAVVALRHRSRATLAWVAAAAPLAGLILLGTLTPTVLGGGIVRADHAWLPQIGLQFSLRLDGLAWMFAGLVLAIGALVVMYAHYYLSARENAARFYGYLLLFMGAMLGMVIAGNLLLLMVFWELTSISSFLLIGFWSHRKDARDGARMALVITGGGGLALLGGVLLLGRIVGSYQLDAVLAAGAAIRASALYPWALGLILLGIFTKSAQFPFHFWLPHAMAAPTPVSAYLHSATMVKAGVFLLARLHPALAGSDLFFYTVSGVGAVTLLVGAWYAIFQHDLKGLLAYSTISHLGLITMLFGLSTPLAVVAGVFHILNHAVFKASLFMAAGIIDHETHTRDMRRLGNLRRWMPFTSALAIIASLSMAGIPLLNGFLSKEMFFAQALDADGPVAMRVFTATAALLAGVLGVAYSLRFVYETFFGTGPRQLEALPHEPPRWMKIPVEVLVLVCVAVGIFPALTVAPVLRSSAGAILGDALPEYSLAVWHGWNAPLAMSIAGMVGGVALYFGLRRLTVLYTEVRRSLGKRVFHWQVDALFGIAARFTRMLSNGSLQRSLRWLLLSAVVVAAAPFVAAPPLWSQWPAPQPMPLLGWALWLLIVSCALATLFLYRQRLLAVLVIGGSGLGVSLVFVFLSAPDLALTQLLVEMVTLVLMLLAMNYLPKASPVEPQRWRKLRDAALAIAAGTGMALLAYSVMTRPAATMAGELLQRALPEAYGRNVVNVILVDFRGFDTFGEITVFGIAALVVHALLRRARMAPEKVMPGPPIKLPVPADLAQLMFPLTLTVSIFLFLRGHNAPGGGFIAGLVLAVPLLIQYVIQGAASVESRFGFDYIRCIGLGLLLAALSGMASLLFGVPFLTSGHYDLYMPLIGNIPLASALGFDTGVYLVVFGGTMLTLSMMGTIKPSRTRASQRGEIDPAQRSARTGEMH